MGGLPDTPTRRRRFQFSLRTLMIFVALLAVLTGAARHIANEAAIVKARKEWLRNPFRDFPFSTNPKVIARRNPKADPSWLRVWLGDKPEEQVETDSYSEGESLKMLFPEATINVYR